MLDLTGNSLGNDINSALALLNPMPSSPIAANATAPNFAYSPNVTAQTTVFQDGYIYTNIDYANPIPVNSYMPYVYLYDLGNPLLSEQGATVVDGYVYINGNNTGQMPIISGYYKLIPDGYYSMQATSGQQKVWITVAQQILQYLVLNTQVNIPSLPVPAAGLEDSTMHPVTGTANSTPEVGTIE